MYKLTVNASIVIRVADGASIPHDSSNRDWIDYETWLSLGNVPEEAENIVHEG